MSRLDDAAKFCMPELKQYFKYTDWAFIGRLVWNKNVREDQDAPLQLLLPAGNPSYNLHSLLGLWLEYHCEFFPKDNEFVFCVEGLEDPIQIKEKITKMPPSSSKMRSLWSVR